MADDKSLRDVVHVPAAEKVLHVLAAFELRPRWLLRELAAQVGIPKSSVHRLLASLRSMQFVQQDPRDGSYHLGPQIWRLASRSRDFDTLADVARPVLQMLVGETRESAFLTVQDGLHSLCIARASAPHGVRLLIDLGTASPLHLGASNSILLAFLPEVERSMILSQTVLQPAERVTAEAEMRRIADAGYAFSSSQLTPGAAAIGVPVFDSVGRIAAALSIGAPAFRFDMARALEVLPLLRRAAGSIAQRIGHTHSAPA